LDSETIKEFFVKAENGPAIPFILEQEAKLKTQEASDTRIDRLQYRLP
jgi:hypothetical protein